MTIFTCNKEKLSIKERDEWTNVQSDEQKYTFRIRHAEKLADRKKIIKIKIFFKAKHIFCILKFSFKAIFLSIEIYISYILEVEAKITNYVIP